MDCKLSGSLYLPSSFFAQCFAFHRFPTIRFATLIIDIVTNIRRSWCDACHCSLCFRAKKMFPPSILAHAWCFKERENFSDIHRQWRASFVENLFSLFSISHQILEKLFFHRLNHKKHVGWDISMHFYLFRIVHWKIYPSEKTKFLTCVKKSTGSPLIACTMSVNTWVRAFLP